jgi:hypothetical protein
MIATTKQQTIKMKGEIAEVFQKNGHTYARISVNPCLIELCLEDVPDVPLGGEVEMEVQMIIENLEVI